MLQKLFGFDPAKHSVRTEIMAGVTTFLTMAYILAVNPNILGTVMNANGVFVATALASAIATFIMAFLAKRFPICLIPEQPLISPMRYDMIYDRCRDNLSLCQTESAERMLL